MEKFALFMVVIPAIIAIFGSIMARKEMGKTSIIMTRTVLILCLVGGIYMML
jgi:hypothetical protein